MRKFPRSRDSRSQFDLLEETGRGYYKTCGFFYGYPDGMGFGDGDGNGDGSGQGNGNNYYPDHLIQYWK